MLKLARWSTTHRKYVVLGWIALLVVVNVLAQSAGTSYSNNFTLPNSDAQRASDLLQHSFPAQAGDRDTIVFKVNSGTVRDPAVQRADGARCSTKSRSCPTSPPSSAPTQPPAGQGDLRRRAASRSRRSCSTRKPTCCPRAPPNASCNVARAAAQPGLEVELGGQAIEQTEQAGLRDLDSGRAARRDRRAADHVRLADRDGPADRHRAVRPRHRPRPDRPVHARRRHAELLLRARGDDRARRRHRLRAVHPHALPRGLPHARPHVPRRARSRSLQRDRHRRARRAVRRHDGRDRAARHDAARRQLPLRGGDLSLDRRAARDARLAHAAARPADHDRRESRLRQPRARARRQEAAAAGSSAANGANGASVDGGDGGEPLGGRTWLRWSQFVGAHARWRSRSARRC